MTAAYKASGAGAITITSGAALTPAIPAGTVAGDLLVAPVFYGGTAAAPDTPSGWDPWLAAQNMDTPATNGRVWLFRKKAVGGDAAPAFGTQAVTVPRRARVHSFSGALDDTVANMCGGLSFAIGTTTPLTDTGVTTGADAEDYLCVQVILGADDTLAPGAMTGETGGDWTIPAGFTAFTSTTGTPDTWMGLQTAVVAPSTTINGGSATTVAGDPWGVFGFYIRSRPPRDTAPTMVDSSEVANWFSSTTPRSAGSVSWQAGDIVVVHGGTANDGSILGTPTVAGLTFALVNSIGALNTCNSYVWAAEAASNGSGAIQGTRTGTVDNWGIAVEVWRGSDGVGANAVEESTTKTLSLTRTDDKSAVSYGGFDFSASSAAATWTPSGQTVIESSGDDVSYGIHIAHWGDQGAAGPTSYGVSSASTGNFAKVVVEILGTIGGAVDARPRGHRSPAVQRRIPRRASYV